MATIYIVMGKGKEVSHSGKVEFDSEGKWMPKKFPIEGYSEICAYLTEEDAEWHKKQFEGNAEYYGYECEYKVVPVRIPVV